MFDSCSEVLSVRKRGRNHFRLKKIPGTFSVRLPAFWTSKTTSNDPFDFPPEPLTAQATALFALLSGGQATFHVPDLFYINSLYFSAFQVRPGSW